MKPVLALTVTISASLLLAACGDAEEQRQPSASAKASGKILERSITDEMLPYDTVTSQPPRAKPVKEEGGGNGGSRAAPAGEPEAETVSAEADAPVESGAPDPVTPDEG